MTKIIETNTFGSRFKRMLSVDLKRMRLSPLFYILIGTAALIPILVIVMTTSVSGGAATTAPAANSAPTVEMQPITNTWQVVETVSGEASMSMDIMSMCNINLLFLAVAVWCCLFISEDFKSGYVKNLFAVRASKADYVLSKALVGLLCSLLMIVAYVGGAMLGGLLAGLSFSLNGVGIGEVLLCLLSKLLLMASFLSIYTVASVIGKQKTWLSLLLSLAVAMLFFMMIPALTPLNAGLTNVILCLIIAICSGIGLGTVSTRILRKTNLV